MPYIAANDLNVYYVEKGEGVPIIFVPGNWVTSLSWKPVIDRLPDGYRGITYDMRGRGRTEGPDNDYTMPELAGDLLATVDALRLDKFHLVGHSLGSAIAMQFALDHPTRLDSLLLLAPAWVDGMQVANVQDVEAAQQILIDNEAFFRQAFKAMMPTLNDEAYVDQLVKDGRKQRVEATMRNVPALINWRPGETLRSIGVPSLVVSGEFDALTGGANADRTAAALGTKHVTMQGVGHSPNIEAPERFVELLLPFVSKQLKEGDE
jgi:pimeloyl-ACP methyl ester carboxylesterase